MALAADQHSRRVQRYRAEVPGGIRQRRTPERQMLFTTEGNERLRIHTDGRLPKNRAHRSAHGFRGIQIGTALKQHHQIHPKGIRRAQDRSDIPGILQLFQRQHPADLIQIRCGGHAYRKERAGGIRHRGYIVKQIRGKQSFLWEGGQIRRPVFFPEDCFNRGAAAQGLLQKLLAVAQKKPLFFPRCGRTRKVAESADHRTFPACQPLHSLLREA